MEGGFNGRNKEGHEHKFALEQSLSKKQKKSKNVRETKKKGRENDLELPLSKQKKKLLQKYQFQNKKSTLKSSEGHRFL